MDLLEIFLKKYPGGSIKDYQEFLIRREDLKSICKNYQDLQKARENETLTAKQYNRYVRNIKGLPS